jgi:hypothetical protein
MTIDMTSCTIQGRRQRHAELAGLGAEIQAGCVIFVDVNIMCPYLDAADDRFCVTLLLEQTGLEGQWQKPKVVRMFSYGRTCLTAAPIFFKPSSCDVRYLPT